MCDKIFKFCKIANLDVQQEQRYESDGDGNKIRIQGRPGDIKINNYFTTTTLPKNVKHRNLYVDITVANIFAPTYLKRAAKKRSIIATEKEKHKLKKYQDCPNIMGIGFECMGAMSKNGKRLINYIAERISLLKNIPKSLMINRIRSNLLADMMQSNANMIIKCYNL